MHSFLRQPGDDMNRNLTEDGIWKSLLRFSIPYLISCFLQTFYGMADLFITGQFNQAGHISAVSVGSQLMHMLTVVIVGLAMGTTVSIGRAAGGGDDKKLQETIGNTFIIFGFFALVLTVCLLALKNRILSILSVPEEAFGAAGSYAAVCFAGIPLIVAYNVMGSIFRGIGDTRHPMYYVAASGIVNIGLDYLLIGYFGMGATGAALATVISQAGAAALSVAGILKRHPEIRFSRKYLKVKKQTAAQILSIGVPISCQDGLIQVSFLVITAIANSRGVNVSAAVGIVEKIISFLFLVPSAMLSSVAALAARNAGAGQNRRAQAILHHAVMICLVFGGLVFLVCQFVSGPVVSVFVHNEPEVVRLGGQYLKAYALDCVFAGVHFCFSGYFSAYGKSIYSFIHNVISIVLVRIPGAWLASVFFPETLYPMGLAAPMGSLLSALICIFLFVRNRRWFLQDCRIR